MIEKERCCNYPILIDLPKQKHILKVWLVTHDEKIIKSILDFYRLDLNKIV